MNGIALVLVIVDFASGVLAIHFRKIGLVEPGRTRVQIVLQKVRQRF